MQECPQKLTVHCFVIAACLLLGLGGPAQAQGPTTTDARAAYEDALDKGLYGEAEQAAKIFVDKAIRDGRRDELSTAALFGDLALVQRLNRNFEAALQNYELAINIVQTNRDMLDSALIEPLLGIGKTHIDSGRPSLAMRYLDRALHVRHVNDGPHSLDQTETLESLAEAYRQMDELQRAIDVAERLVLLNVRNFSSDSVELIPSLLLKGQFLGEAKNWREERNAYNAAAKIAKNSEGDTSINLARPQLMLGRSHLNEYFDLYFLAETERELPDPQLMSEAEDYFESALDISRKDDSNWQIHSEALLAMADFYTLNDEPGRARLLYRDAWQLLTADVDRIQLRGENLEISVPLIRPEPDLVVGLPHDESGKPLPFEYEPGYLVTQFTVSRRGRLTAMGLVEMSPERNDKIEAEVKRVLTSSVYRPRFENGFAVDTPGMTVRYEFPYPLVTDTAE